MFFSYEQSSMIPYNPFFVRADEGMTMEQTFGPFGTSLSINSGSNKDNGVKLLSLHNPMNIMNPFYQTPRQISEIDKRDNNKQWEIICEAAKNAEKKVKKKFEKVKNDIDEIKNESKAVDQKLKHQEDLLTKQQCELDQLRNMVKQLVTYLDNTTYQQSVPQQSVPQQSVPQQSVPQQSVPQQRYSQQQNSSQHRYSRRGD